MVRNQLSNASKAEIDGLASAFLAYYHVHNHPLISTRDALATVFSDFMTSRPDDCFGNRFRSTESLVMARMRQRKWMKVDRRITGQVCLVVRLVGKDRQTFPAHQEVQTARELLRQHAQEAERDKSGVFLQVFQQDVQIKDKNIRIKDEDVRMNENPPSFSVAVGKEGLFAFRLVVGPEEDPYTTVILHSVELRGPHAHRLVPHGPATGHKLNHLPWAFDKNDPLWLSYLLLAPQTIGLQKIQFHVALEKEDDSAFEICRTLYISCGNPDIDAVLQPKSPYQRRKRSKGPTINAVHWPEKSGDSQNALMDYSNIGKYHVPKEIQWMLDNNELQGHLEALDWSPKTTATIRAKTSKVTTEDNDESYKSDLKDYGECWSLLLHASECQSLIDIQMFDQENVQLHRAPHNMFALTVPGLAEGRPSVLRGDMVNLTWKSHLYKGRVQTTHLLQVILQMPNNFSKSFNPSVDRVDLVRFTFSRTTYRTSHQACLKYARQYLGPEILEPTVPMIEKYRASLPDRFHRGLSFASRNLNPEQEQAVYRIVQGEGGSKMPYILFGPPGTGKTTLVVETVYQLAARTLGLDKRRPKILLVAPSNDASDILVQRLSQYFPQTELLRVLAYGRKREDLPPGIRPYASSIGDLSVTEAITAASIVVSTVNLAARFAYMGVKRGHFDCIVVDEAGHATEPELIAIAASLLDKRMGTETKSQLVLAGDPRQLGPITTSKICEAYGYGVSLLERLSQRNVYKKDPVSNSYPSDLVTKLVRNYRSHPSFLKLPNDLYYDGDLQTCGDILSTHSLCRWEHLPKAGFPLFFHSIKGRNLREGNSPSWFNPEEAQQVVAYVDLLIQQSRPPVAYTDIGIITPYARQAQKIRDALEVNHPGSNIKVGSVETFQGQERRVIILSTVRSEPELFFDHDTKYNLGFVAHPKRFNVAMTRAKALLVVVGCPAVLSLDRENWLPFLMYCHEQSAWRGDPWDPKSTAEEGTTDVHDEDSQELREESWDVVQAEEVFGYVHREE